jgi:hypothetical protein
MVERKNLPKHAVSPLVGLFILAKLGANELAGCIVATIGDLAVVEASKESGIQGKGFLLLKLSGVALPAGHCRLFRTREELAEARSIPQPARPGPGLRLVLSETLRSDI